MSEWEHEFAGPIKGTVEPPRDEGMVWLSGSDCLSEVSFVPTDSKPDCVEQWWLLGYEDED